jgi:hypothetical protein
MIVHEDARRDMHRADQDHAVLQIRLRAEPLDIAGDVQNFVTLFRLDRQIVGVRNHAARVGL